MCDFDGLDWEDIAMAGALVEELAEGEKEIERIRKEIEEEREQDEGKDEDPLK
jgi:hypothetical protein